MRAFMRMLRSRRDPQSRRLAAWTMFFALGAIVVGSAIDRAVREGPASAIGFLLPEDPASTGAHASLRSAGAQVGIDASPTGSIRPVILDPCTGMRK